MANGRMVLKERKRLSRIDRSSHAPFFLFLPRRLHEASKISEKHAGEVSNLPRSLKHCDCTLEFNLFCGEISKLKIQIFPDLNPEDGNDRLSRQFDK
jgi:hypothetical protein